jgi:ketosteroid isomerase-like protein
MPSHPTFLLTLACVALLPACAKKHPSNEADLKALMDTSRAWAKTVPTRNVDAIMRYWTDDALLMMPGEPPHQGQADIRRYVDTSLKTPGFDISWEPLTGAVSKSGDIGYLVERDRISFPDGHGGVAHQVFRAVTVWRKQPDGSWKDAIDISAPAPAAAR